MTDTQLIGLLPLLVLGATAVATMLAIAVRRSHFVAATVAAGGMLTTLACLPTAWERAPVEVTPLIGVDRYGLFFVGVIVLAALLTALLACEYLARRARRGAARCEEFYVLLSLGTLGAATLVLSRHFASFFVGLELLTVSLYGLIAYLRTKRVGLEAAAKYLVLAATASATLLFGIALVFAATGTMEFAAIGRALESSPPDSQLLVRAGGALVLAGVGFKLALAPFHMWTPDVYEGAPAPVSAFVATVSKAGVFAVTLRFLAETGLVDGVGLASMIAALAILSMFVGNLLALLSSNVKRILAYSSIAHLGYALVPLLVGGALGHEAAVFYLVSYVPAILGAFAVVSIASGDDSEAVELDDYRGMARRRPLLAFALVVVLLSLAGIPITSGFMGKFYLLASTAKADFWGLALVVVFNSALGLFYYLRIVTVVFQAPSHGADVGEHPLEWGSRFALASAVLLVVALGVWPELVLAWIRAALPV